MKSFTNENFKKELRKKNNPIKVGLLFIVAAIACVLGAYSMENKVDDNIPDFHSVIIGDNRLYKKAYIDVTSDAYRFATYDDDDSSYYFVMDKDYIYVVFMKDAEAKKFSDLEESGKSIKVSGKTASAPSDVKKLAIEYYNTGVDEEYQLTIGDYDMYFGDVVLDLTQEDDVVSVLYVFFGILNFTGIILIISGVITRSLCVRAFNKLSDEEKFELDNEMNDKDAFYYKGAHVYLTKNYIINLKGKVKTIKYSDILWIYPFETRYNGIKTSKCIKVVTNDGKTNLIANLDVITKKSQTVFNEIYETIASKNKKILTGYTPENIKEMRSKVKEIKKERKRK